MKKKPSAKVKKSPAKPKQTNVVIGKKPRAVVVAKSAPKRTSLADDPRFAQAVQNYESGLRLMQERKFERARAAFQKVVSGPSKELADRVSVHLSTVNQYIAREGASDRFKSAEEHYDYAISLLNTGDYDSAREHLEKLTKQSPKAD